MHLYILCHSVFKRGLPVSAHGSVSACATLDCRTFGWHSGRSLGGSSFSFLCSGGCMLYNNWRCAPLWSCGAGLGFVSPCVGSENWFAWYSRSISLSARLLLFLIGRMVFFHTTTFVRCGAATVTVSFSWLGCGLSGVCLGLVFPIRCGLFGSFVIVMFGFF